MKSTYKAISALATLIGLSGCAVGPVFHEPDIVPNSSSYTPTPIEIEKVSIEGQNQRLVSGKDIPAQWWAFFHCKALDDVMQQALVNSPTLAKTEAKLRQAQEEWNAQTGATEYPHIDADGSIKRQRINTKSLGLPIASQSPFTLYNASIEVSYTFDVYGANRYAVEALQSEVDYQHYQREAAYLSLTANIVTSVIKEASLRAQIKVLENIVGAQEMHNTIIKQRQHLGGASRVAELAQQSQLAQTQAILAPLRAQLEQIRHQRAIYMGVFPGEAHMPEFSLEDLQLPSEIPLSLPSRLVHQRPDIQAVSALLHKASANVGIATANLYPHIILSANMGSIASHVSDLFGGGSGLWSIAPAVTQPIFHGGELRAQKRAAMAAYDQAVAAYKETVLQGFQNVADTLRALEADAKTGQARNEEVEQAHESYEITAKQYALGGVSHTALLDAQSHYQQVMLEQIQTKASRYANSVALIQALGGGWWNSSLP